MLPSFEKLKHKLCDVRCLYINDQKVVFGKQCVRSHAIHL